MAVHGESSNQLNSPATPQVVKRIVHNHSAHAILVGQFHGTIHGRCGNSRSELFVCIPLLHRLEPTWNDFDACARDATPHNAGWSSATKVTVQVQSLQPGVRPVRMHMHDQKATVCAVRCVSCQCNTCDCKVR